jgi:ABC-type amino acid transport substrate-binding protein
VARPYETGDHALTALRLGQANAAVVDETTLRLYRRTHPDWDAMAGFGTASITSVPYAAAVRIDQPRLHAALERALARLQADGRLTAMLTRWL